ncbi:hypothetical protein V7127_02570 [Bacillus sp. JJ1773]|uniref:hypothetical protein n=1 Tax=Bacillus sp. JJ1773 TaxID=3122965 RepID=UPI002FFFB109
MIPIHLLDALVNRFESEFKEFQLKDPKSPEEYKKINIFSQHLPIKSKGKAKDTSLYPYLIIRITDGGEDSSEETGKSQILFIAGVYDESEDNQGFRDAIALINKVYQSLIRDPMVNDMFELDYPIRWTYQDEDSEPYYFSGLETNWKVPKPIREDLEGLI